MERDIFVALVLEVEKHECLYNTTLPEYARKEETEKAWLEISNNIQLPVHECKDKWRNIRSTFRRSFKPSPNAKPKRTYYLSRYLDFILPYSKPMDDSIFRKNNAVNQKIDITVIKDEDSGNSAPEDDERLSTSTSSQDHVAWHETHDSLDLNRTLSVNKSANYQPSLRRQRLSSEEEFSIPEHLRSKPEQGDDGLLYRSDKDHMRYFFLSLLPEFANMSEQQIRTFKIKVLQLIDDIKTDRSAVASSSKNEVITP